MTRKKVLLTGATGFIGSALLRRLHTEQAEIHVGGRAPLGAAMMGVEGFKQIDLQQPEAIARLDLHGVDAVCHLAARVHVMNDSKENESQFDRMNTQATIALARACVGSGVRRLVFLSSIKVNGERTDGRAFRYDDIPEPQDAYGHSKWNAERALAQVAHDSKLEVCIVRPPLVYGPGVGANFRKLITLVQSGWPIPLGGVDNRRSLVSLWNLVDFLREAVLGDKVGPGTWLISDGHDVSTPALIANLAVGLGEPARLCSLPVWALAGAAAALGRGDQLRRLIESLQVDITPTLSATGWRPPVALEEGVRRTAHWYLHAYGSRG